MKKQDIYRLLEQKMLEYNDYADMPVKATREALVSIPTNANLTARQADTAMLAYTGKRVFVRSTVLQKLKLAARLLGNQDASLQLEVAYGYRALEIQAQLFKKYKARLAPQLQGQELLAAVHRLVAVPEAAGHPAGAAVDIQICRNGEPLDFGTKLHQFVPDTFTFSPFVSTEAWANRLLLRRVMLQAGFAPFDGEWWHFSYGDKEWAAYYDEQAALYEQLNFNA